jgi:hypothetical protein
MSLIQILGELHAELADPPIDVTYMANQRFPLRPNMTALAETPT